MVNNPLSNQFLVAKTTNPNYLVHIRCAGLGFELVADMPEQTTYAIGADYEAQLPGSTSDLGGLGSGLIAFATGTHASLQSLTRQIWRNSSPLEIPIVVQFDARDNAFENVYRPMRLLEALAMPTTGTSLLDRAAAFLGSGLLYSPNSDGNTMAISIGRMLNLTEVLLVSCQNTYDSRLSQGYPIAGQCELVFRTPKVVSRAEWLAATGANFS